MYSKSEPEPHWSWVAWARGFTVWISSFLLESLNAWFWDNSDHYIWLFVSRKCCYASEFKNHVFFFFLVILILLTLTCPLPAIYLVSLRLKKKMFSVSWYWFHGSILAAYFPFSHLNPAILLDEIFILSTPTGYQSNSTTELDDAEGTKPTPGRSVSWKYTTSFKN